MMTEPTVAEELVRLEGLVARAKGEVEAGLLVDLSQLDRCVREVCARVTALPAAEGQAFRARLLSLYDELGHLAETVRRTVGALEANMGDNAKRRKATSAYRQAPQHQYQRQSRPQE